MREEGVVVGMDWGCESGENMKVCRMKKVDLVMKGKGGKERGEEWVGMGEKEGMWDEEGVGKKVYRGRGV